MPHRSTETNLPEDHPDHFVAHDPKNRRLAEANQLIALANNEKHEADQRLTCLERGMKILDELNVVPEMVGFTRGKLEALIGSLRRAINPDLIYSAHVAVDDEDPYYV